MSSMKQSAHTQCYDAYAPLSKLERCVREGHNVLILMRGVPGSGKSHLAKQIAKLREDAQIFSTDDFFMQNGKYVFNSDLLAEYHRKNLLLARDAMQNNVTPVIIDNTNIFAEHMKQYVFHAAANYYEVYIVESTADWSRKAAECARKNTHGVSKEKIKQMLDQLDLEGDPPLAILLGKEKLLQLVPTHHEEEEHHHSPIPKAVPPEPKNAFAGIFSMKPRQLIVNTAPPGFSPIFSMAPPPVSPTVRVKMRDVGTQDNEVSVCLSNLGFEALFDDKLEAGEEYEITRKSKEKPPTTDRCLPYNHEARDQKLIEASDLDLLVSIFPNESMATLHHYYQQHGLEKTIQLQFEMGIMADEYAEVRKGAFSYEISKALLAGQCEPEVIDYPRDDSEYNTCTSGSDVVQQTQEQVYVELGEPLCKKLEELFGKSGHFDQQGGVALVPMKILKSIFEAWTAPVDGGTQTAWEERNSNDRNHLDSDAELARKLHEEEMRGAKGGVKVAQTKGLTGAQHLQLQALINDFPGMDSEALKDFFIANRCSSTHTRNCLIENGYTPATNTSTRTFVPGSGGPAASSSSRDSRDSSESRSAPLHTKVTGGPVWRNNFEAAHQKVQELHVEYDAIRKEMEKIATKARGYVGQRNPMIAAVAVYKEEGKKYKIQEQGIRNQIFDIIKRANDASDYLDLHFLTQHEALQVVRERLAKCDRPAHLRNTRSSRKLSIVTGRGRNSNDNSVVKNSIASYLRSSAYEISWPNPGEVLVTCK